MRYMRSSAEHTKQILSNKTADELRFILGRYCRPDARILSLKEFGILLDRKTVQDLLIEISFEESILDNNTTDLI